MQDGEARAYLELRTFFSSSEVQKQIEEYPGRQAAREQIVENFKRQTEFKRAHTGVNPYTRPAY